VEWTRHERFAALDEQLETALRIANDRQTAVVVGGGEPIDLPPETLKILHKVVHGLASGTEAMLATTEAADFLDVSRPYLTRLLKAWQVPYRKRGNREHPAHHHCEALDRVRDALGAGRPAGRQAGARERVAPGRGRHARRGGALEPSRHWCLGTEGGAPR
jgi:hypothetical protein